MKRKGIVYSFIKGREYEIQQWFYFSFLVKNYENTSINTYGRR